MSISGYDAYRIYQSIHLHFTSKKWKSDALQNGKLVVIKPESFVAKTNSNAFETMARKFDRTSWFRYCVANELYGFTNCVYDYEVGSHNLKVWEGVKERLSYILDSDLDFLYNVGFFKNPSIVVRALVQNKIKIESAVTFNKLENFTDAIRNGKNYSEIIEPLLFRVDRGAVFVKTFESIKEKYYNLKSQPIV